MLDIVNLHVEVEGKKVLNGICLSIEPGEAHVLLGPNGSGKTTLVNAIMGNPKVRILDGRIYFKGKDITGLPTHERVRMGIGVAFQHPPSIKGVKLKALLDKLSSKLDKDVDLESVASLVGMQGLLDREVNVGFSGGELKKSEVLQLLVQSPDLALFDEPDSGVDVENLVVIANAINELCEMNAKPSARNKSALLITHLSYILKYVKADRAHVLIDGRIACSGKPGEIMNEIIEHGFGRCAECLRERM
ncbi:MAG: ABC transporter ATP-binding protein [Candidatus Bathyarchaeia archaeon]